MQQEYFISHPDQTGHARARIKTTTNEQSWTIENANHRIYTCFGMMPWVLFSPEVKKSHSSLHWDCIPFFVECNQSDNQFKENLKTLNRMKEAKKESKSDLASCYILLHMYMRP